MNTPSLMRRWDSSTFLHVLEVSHDSRHLLEVTCGSSVQLASSKVSSLPFPWELSSRSAPLLLGARGIPVPSLPYPIALGAFLQVYKLGLVCPLWPNYFLDLRLGWGLFHSPKMFWLPINWNNKHLYANIIPYKKRQNIWKETFIRKCIWQGNIAIYIKPLTFI